MTCLDKLRQEYMSAAPNTKEAHSKQHIENMMTYQNIKIEDLIYNKPNWQLPKLVTPHWYYCNKFQISVTCLSNSSFYIPSFFKISGIDNTN